MNKEKNTVIGIVAHVDAGKTTLSEAMLYLSGKINKLGRVDHRDSYLDTHELERSRGITIFSKQALLRLENTNVTLLDTPGHADFSAEAERTMQVLDYAVLVISATDGVQAHTETVWRLLRRYNIPCFIFVTKMDLPCGGRDAVMTGLKSELSAECIDFSGDSDFQEHAAMCSEQAMEKYLSMGRLDDADIATLISKRLVYPVYFGSGLKTDGVEEFLKGLDKYTEAKDYGDKFAARVFKIARDEQGGRMTFMKVTGGSLKVRSALEYKDENGELRQEKINQLRLYSGIKYDKPDEVFPGQVCACLGLSGTYPGMALGAESAAVEPVLEPVMSYRVQLPQEADARAVLPLLLQLGEEDPMLHVSWNERLGEIQVQLMGTIQAEIFKSLAKDRFDLDIELHHGRVMYRETIADKVEGVGHFEPLRHYAEVHLIMEPLPAGSGIVLDTVCSEDEFDRNWQRLILTHLQERSHPGVLTGSPITDMKITLAAGKAHIKHTEGGDFRQATYRAVRQGLMRAKSVLLEPYYAFSLSVPADMIGRAISDVRAMGAQFESPSPAGDMMKLEGAAPVSMMNGYAAQVAAYTHGRGRLFSRPAGYRPCKNQAEIIENIGYDAESDTDNPADSVFCAHGGGFNVRWDKVPEYMHLESCLIEKKPEPLPMVRRPSLNIDERELEAIMDREFGPIRRPEYSVRVNNAPAQPAPAEKKREYIIVDGYNVIFAWEELKKLAQENLDLARSRLMDILSNYSGFTHAELVLVFDAYRTPGNPGSRTDYHNIHVAYTKENETGDAYIERMAAEIGKNYSVRVVTSDNLIRLSALHSGVLRTSSKEFEGEVEWVLEQIDAVLQKSNMQAHKTRLKDGKQQ